MTEFAKRLKTLRESTGKSQTEFGKLLGVTQASVARYENGVAFPPLETILWYADYFDCSLDYIFGRCDSPHGKLYDCKPPVNPDNEELKEFIEMCFEPNSSASKRLKEALYSLMEENRDEK